MKTKIFIGSSAESLFIAKALERQLVDVFDVKVWDRAFVIGDFFLERLQKELFLTDYALFLIAPDDKISKRGRQAYATRDNVIFELGMFTGALGVKKAHFLIVDIVKDGVVIPLKLPSDLDGIKKSRIKIWIDQEGRLLDNEENARSLAEAANGLTERLNRRADGLSLKLLPSTPLAIGYYRNFILPACTELSSRKSFVVDGASYDLTKDIFDFYIVLPDTGNGASHEGYRRFVRRNSLQQIEIKSENSARTFPFFVRSSMSKSRMQLYDLPTTLRVSWETIRMVMPRGTPADEIEELESKEIANFRDTIEFLLKEPESADFRDNIHLIKASELS